MALQDQESPGTNEKIWKICGSSRAGAIADEERGIVLVILRFGKVEGVQNAASVTQYDRIVGEFFAVKAGKIQEVQAVLVDRPDAKPTGWGTKWFGPGAGGWKSMPTGQ